MAFVLAYADRYSPLELKGLEATRPSIAFLLLRSTMEELNSRVLCSLAKGSACISIKCLAALLCYAWQSFDSLITIGVYILTKFQSSLINMLLVIWNREKIPNTLDNACYVGKF